MKLCNNCNKLNNEQNKFCDNCGYKFENEIIENDQYFAEYQENKKRYFLVIGLYFAMFYIFSTILSFILVFIFKLLNITNEYTLEALVNFLVYLASLAIIIPIVFKTFKNDFADFKKSAGKNFKWYGLGIAILYIGSYLAIIIINLISTIFDLNPGESTNQATIESILSSGFLNATLMSIMTIICAPILEEIVFRRCLFGIFKNNSLKVVVLSTILFAGIHTIPSCLIMIPSVITKTTSLSTLILEFLYILNYMGQAFALSYVYYKTDRNIIPCIMIHMTNNLIATISILFSNLLF